MHAEDAGDVAVYSCYKDGFAVGFWDGHFEIIVPFNFEFGSCVLLFNVKMIRRRKKWGVLA